LLIDATVPSLLVPVSADAVKATVISPSPGIAMTALGADGGVAALVNVTEDDADDAMLVSPAELVEVTVHV